MAEHGCANIGDYTLADPRNVVEANKSPYGDKNNNADKKGEAFIKCFLASSAQALIDNELKAHADAQRRGRCKQQGKSEDRHVARVGPHETVGTTQVGVVLALGSVR